MDLEKKYWFIWILLMVGLQQYATFYAPGITNDSEQYLIAAHSFSEKGIFLAKDGNYYGAHTPLYPMMLSIGIDHVLKWARMLNMVSLVAALWLMFLLGEKLIHHSVSRWLYQGSLALGTPILLVGNFVWSEPLFLLFLSVIWYLLYSYYQRSSNHYLVWLILVTNLLCLQRNAGIFFFFVVMVVLFLRQQKWHALLYGALGAMGFIGWNIYVYHITTGSQNIAEQAYFFSFFDDFLENFQPWLRGFFLENGRCLSLLP